MEGHSEFIRWWVDYRNEMFATRTIDEALSVVSYQASRLGFDYFAFAIKQPVPFTKPLTTVRGSYPQPWLDRYHSQNYGMADPAINTSLKTSRVVIWNGSLRDSNPLLFGEASEHGLKVGLTTTRRSANNLISVLSFSREYVEVGEIESVEVGLKISCIADVLGDQLAQLRDPVLLSSLVILSVREVEVLKWTADGKSSGEISSILLISENTVNFHLKNIQKKFGAYNRTLAASYAAVMGII